MPATRDPLICLRVPDALNERLRAEAAKTGQSMSELVRDALEARLRRRAKPDVIRTEAGVRFKPVTEVTDERTGRKHRVRQATPGCEHRVKPGAFCKRCDRLIT